MGTIADRTGVPSAMNTPLAKLHPTAHGIVMRSAETSAAVATAVASAPSWLVMSIARLLKWSESTPTGSEMRRAGMPMTNRMRPLASERAPSPSASHTNAKR